MKLEWIDDPGRSFDFGASGRVRLYAHYDYDGGAKRPFQDSSHPTDRPRQLDGLGGVRDRVGASRARRPRRHVDQGHDDASPANVSCGGGCALRFSCRRHRRERVVRAGGADLRGRAPWTTASFWRSPTPTATGERSRRPSRRRRCSSLTRAPPCGRLRTPSWRARCRATHGCACASTAGTRAPTGASRSDGRARPGSNSTSCRSRPQDAHASPFDPAPLVDLLALLDRRVRATAGCAARREPGLRVPRAVQRGS